MTVLDLCDGPRTYMEVAVFSRPCMMPTETFLGREGGTQPTGDSCLEGAQRNQPVCTQVPTGTSLKNKLAMFLIPQRSPVLTPGKRWACRGGRSRADLLKCRARKREKSQWRNASRSQQGGSQALELCWLFADIKTLCTHEHYGGKSCLRRF